MELFFHFQGFCPSLYTIVNMAYYFMQGLIVLINFYVCMGTNIKTKRGLLNPAFEDISEITHVIDEIDSDGVVNCMMVCSYNVNCRSVSYNNLDSRCRLFSQDLFGQAPTGHSVKGWIHLDLTTVLSSPVDCSDFQSRGYNSSGLYTIGRNQVTVWCDLETDGGGWTVFQRRSDGSVDFHRNWNDYVAGFGDTSREYWIGNDALSVLTSSGINELLILMETWGGVWTHVRYSNFRVKDGTDKYRLHVEGYSGTAGDSLSSLSGQKFSTRDQDNDAWVGPCNPNYHSGGWWFGGCGYSDLNGIYYSSGTIATNSCHWNGIDGTRQSLRTVFMMVRRN